jgi:hypothetical protein
MKPKCTFSRCCFSFDVLLFELCSFGPLYVINICDELCFMISYSVIDQRNYQCSEVCFLLKSMYFCVSASHISFSLVEYRVVNNLVITREKA